MGWNGKLNPTWPTFCKDCNPSITSAPTPWLVIIRYLNLCHCVGMPSSCVCRSKVPWKDRKMPFPVLTKELPLVTSPNLSKSAKVIKFQDALNLLKSTCVWLLDSPLQPDYLTKSTSPGLYLSLMCLCISFPCRQLPVVPLKIYWLYSLFEEMKPWVHI